MAVGQPGPGARALPWRQLVVLFLASRTALLVVAMASARLLPSGLPAQPGNLLAHEATILPLEVWARWDAEWYLLIAEHGYDARTHLAHAGLPYGPAATAGFFPAYPMLIRILAPLLGGVGAGVLVANACLLGALFLLYRLTAIEVGPERGHVAGMAASAMLLLHPSSGFLSAVYPESLFLLLSLTSLGAARHGRLAVAGGAAAVAALTRPFGAVLVLPLLWEWWRRRDAPRQDLRPRRWELLWPALPVVALAGYMSFCASVFGDPLAFVARQAHWRGSLSGPWRAFVRWWQAGPVVHGTHGSTLELGVAVFTVVMLVVVVRRLPAAYGLLAVPITVAALGSTLWSFSRVSLALFPVAMVLGRLWAEERTAVPVAYGFVGGSLAALLTALYASWWWAG